MSEAEILARYKMGDTAKFHDVMTGTRRTGTVVGWGYDRDQRYRTMIVETRLGEIHVTLKHVICNVYF